MKRDFDQDYERNKNDFDKLFGRAFFQKGRVNAMFCFRCGGREFEVDTDHCHCKICGAVQYYAYASVGC